jgi:biotin carboxylase
MTDVFVDWSIEWCYGAPDEWPEEVQGKTIREAGFRTVKQKRTSSWEEARAFIEDWDPQSFEVVVKSTKSAGSHHVVLALTMEEVKASFEAINGQVHNLGLLKEFALIQEYLERTEFVVDNVAKQRWHSQNGCHLRIW